MRTAAHNTFLLHTYTHIFFLTPSPSSRVMHASEWMNVCSQETSKMKYHIGELSCLSICHQIKVPITLSRLVLCEPRCQHINCLPFYSRYTQHCALFRCVLFSLLHTIQFHRHSVIRCLCIHFSASLPSIYFANLIANSWAYNRHPIIFFFLMIPWKGWKLTKNSHWMNFTVANYEKLSIPQWHSKI